MHPSDQLRQLFHEMEFPKDGTASEKLRFALEFAVRAPSPHNSQPWLFRVDHDVVDLFADRSRAQTVTDPDGRELTLACGCALFYLRTTLAHYGQSTHTELLPDANDPDLLARLRLGPPADAPKDATEMFDAIASRVTSRTAYRLEHVDPPVMDELVAAARDEGAWVVVWRDEKDRLACANLVAKADRLQFADPAFRAELAEWMRGNESSVVDGIPGYAIGVGTIAAHMAPMVLRTFAGADGRAAHDRELAVGSPTIVVLGTDGNGPRDWLTSGQALARFLLLAAARNVSVSFLNQPLEVSELRDDVADLLLGRRHAQVILRVGYGTPTRPTPRRPVSDVLRYGHSSSTPDTQRRQP